MTAMNEVNQNHRYTFLGDKFTRADLKGVRCNPIRRFDGRCIVSVKMATALVVTEDDEILIVPRRRLRLNKTLSTTAT